MRLLSLKETLKNNEVIFQAKCLSVGAAVGSLANKLLMVSATDDFANAAQGANANTLINNAVNFICDIFRFVGIMLLAWSVGMLVMAFKNEDADSKSRAMMMAVCSILLIGVKTILKGVLNMA